MLITNMNDAWSVACEGNKALYVDGELWGIVDTARVKFGSRAIQWLLDDCSRIFNVDEEKLLRIKLELC